MLLLAPAAQSHFKQRSVLGASIKAKKELSLKPLIK